jgi:ribosomal protein S18 acetylase RimI-like enzyme
LVELLTSSPSIRAARAEDGDELVSLWAALLEHHRELDPHWQAGPEAEAAWRSFLLRMLDDPDASLLVWDEAQAGLAGSGSRVVGFCATQIRRAPPVLAETGRCEISDIFVRDEARRRGIAAELVRATLDWCAARGVRRVEVRVVARNTAAQGFWRAAGFGDFVDVLQRHL